MKKDWLKFTWKSTHTNFFFFIFFFNFSFSALIDLFMVFFYPLKREGGRRGTFLTRMTCPILFEPMPYKLSQVKYFKKNPSKTGHIRQMVDSTLDSF